MFIYRLVLFGLCILLFCISAADAAKAKMPPGSFLSKPANDVNALCANIKQDKVVAARFSKHYGMPANDIIAYYQQNLKVSTIKKSERYSEYFVAKTGRIQVRKKMLPAGTKVYVTFNGQPIIDLKCGNPLTKTLPKPVVKVEPSIAETPPPEPVEVPMAIIEPEPEPVQPEPVVEVLAQPVMELSSVATSMVTATAETSLLTQGLAGLGAVGALMSKDSSEQPVPEPASMLTLCIGGAGLLLARYRARRR